MSRLKLPARVSAAAVVTSVLVFAFSFVQAEPRLALVIGNGAYENEARLNTPPSDANLMADTLRSVGFELFGGRAHVNVSERKMRDLIDDFTDELGRLAKPVGLFYFSGHGVQVDGRNYMIPVDAKVLRTSHVRSEGISIDNDLLWNMNAARTVDGGRDPHLFGE